MLVETRFVKNVEVSSGIGSSAFVESRSRGRNGLYGWGWAIRADDSDGASGGTNVLLVLVIRKKKKSSIEVVITIDEICSQDQDILNDIGSPRRGLKDTLPARTSCQQAHISWDISVDRLTPLLLANLVHCLDLFQVVICDVSSSNSSLPRNRSSPDVVL